MSCLILHVHGFGGEDYSEKFIALVRNFVKTIHLDNKIFATTHTWDSEKLSAKIIGKNWIKAQEKAVKEVPNFIDSILDYSKNYDNIYISAFSLGTKVVSLAFKEMEELPPNLKGVFFLGSALDKDFRFNKVLPFKIINYYSDSNDKVLKNIYKAMEAKSAGGEVGFLDSKNFINLYTNCSHAVVYRNYKKYIPQIIVSFVAYWNNIQIQKKDVKRSDRKKVKIKINEKKLNMILIINNIAIYQTLPIFRKEKYFIADLEKDAIYAFSAIDSLNNLVSLLEEIDFKYEQILNDKESQRIYKQNHSTNKKQQANEDNHISFSEKVYKFNDVDEILFKAKQLMSKSEEKQLNIKNIALDMQCSWPSFKLFFKKNNYESKVHYRGLIINPDIFTGKEPKLTDSWEDNINSSILDYNRFLTSADYSSTNHSITIRKNNSLPIIHGILINDKHLFWSLLDLKNKYLEGGNSYYMYNTIDNDFGKYYISTFNKWFEQWWDNSEKI